MSRGAHFLDIRQFPRSDSDGFISRLRECWCGNGYSFKVFSTSLYEPLMARSPGEYERNLVTIDVFLS